MLDLYYDLEEREQLLLDEALRKRFVYTDFKVRRAALFTTNVQPPTNEVAATTYDAVSDDQQVGTYQCFFKLNNDEIMMR